MKHPRLFVGVAALNQERPDLSLLNLISIGSLLVRVVSDHGLADDDDRPAFEFLYEAIFVVLEVLELFFELGQRSILRRITEFDQPREVQDDGKDQVPR